MCPIHWRNSTRTYHPCEIICPVFLEPDESPIMYKTTRADEYRFGRSIILSIHCHGVTSAMKKASFQVPHTVIKCDFFHQPRIDLKVHSSTEESFMIRALAVKQNWHMLLEPTAISKCEIKKSHHTDCSQSKNRMKQLHLYSPGWLCNSERPL